jgi:stage II sporulation protein GA (sporulation sigma-E factor processing peptidase)
MKYLLVKLASWYLEKHGIIYMTKDSFKVPVIIKFKDCELELKGLIDTGNALIEPISQYPVIVVESKSIKNILDNNIFNKTIPYNTINTIGSMKIFQPEEIRIKNKKISKVIIGICERNLSPDGSYNAILHPNLLFA